MIIIPTGDKLSLIKKTIKYSAVENLALMKIIFKGTHAVIQRFHREEPGVEFADVLLLLVFLFIILLPAQ